MLIVHSHLGCLCCFVEILVFLNFLSVTNVATLIICIISRVSCLSPQCILTSWRSLELGTTCSSVHYLPLYLLLYITSQSLVGSLCCKAALPFVYSTRPSVCLKVASLNRDLLYDGIVNSPAIL